MKQLPACGVLILGLILCLSGCGGHKSADNTSTPAQTNETAAAAAENQTPVNTQSSTPAAATVQANAEPDLPELNRAVRRWLMANRRRPASFEDFAATAGVPIPPPPAGKKYFLSSDMHVQLVPR
jgi:hypothetical protein